MASKRCSSIKLLSLRFNFVLLIFWRFVATQFLVLLTSTHVDVTVCKLAKCYIFPKS